MSIGKQGQAGAFRVAKSMPRYPGTQVAMTHMCTPCDTRIVSLPPFPSDLCVSSYLPLSVILNDSVSEWHFLALARIY